MPAWISVVPKAPWSLPIKKGTLISMAIISTIFTATVITKPNADSTTRIIGSVVAIFYLVIVFATTFHSWPR